MTATTHRTTPRRRPPSNKETYWRPYVGGYAEYVGATHPDRQGLCLVHEVKDEDNGLFPMPMVSSIVSTNNSVFRCSVYELKEVSIIVVGQGDRAFCSRCNRKMDNPATAMVCENCRGRFVAICDAHEGAFLSVAELRKDWPLKVIPYHTMTLSRGWHPEVPEEMKGMRIRR